MTREQLVKVYQNAAHIFTQSRLPDVRRKSKEICVLVEAHLGQLGRQPAETWEI